MTKKKFHLTSEKSFYLYKCTDFLISRPKFQFCEEKLVDIHILLYPWFLNAEGKMYKIVSR